MRKQSQRELLEDGFMSTIGGLARVARNAAGKVATAVAPETMGALKKGASLAGGAISNIRSGSPSAMAGVFLDSEEGKRQFKDVKLGNESKLTTGDFKIMVKSGKYLNSLGGANIEEKDLSGGYLIVRRTNKGDGTGFDNEITEVWDKNGQLNKNPIDAGSEVLEPDTTQKSGKEEPAAERPVGDDSDTKRAFNLTKRLAVGSGAKQAKIGAVEPLDRDEMEGFDKEFLAKFKQKVKVQKDGRVSMDGFRFSKRQVKELFKESKKSQKSLLKHLQSCSQMNKWTIGQ